MIIAQRKVGAFIVVNLALWVGTADARDFSRFNNETELQRTVREIPASNKSANAAGYARLLSLNPNKELYWSKYEKYSGSNESGLFKIVRAIPASNRSANAAGYARLLSLDPNNKLYRQKFEKYSNLLNRPAAVDSVSDLKSFLAGSWCVVDDDPTFVAGPYVRKLVILADGNYSLFSKAATDKKWSSTKQRGKMLFREGNDPKTGKEYFYAVSKEYGSPQLVVETNDQKVVWQQVMNDLGETSRDSCDRFE